MQELLDQWTTLAEANPGVDTDDAETAASEGQHEVALTRGVNPSNHSADRNQVFSSEFSDKTRPGRNDEDGRSTADQKRVKELEAELAKLKAAASLIQAIPTYDDYLVRQANKPRGSRYEAPHTSDQPEEQEGERLVMASGVAFDPVFPPTGAPLKSILKPPRVVPFPQPSVPMREGVLPLKDVPKDGIPPGARWTKVRRSLISPEALQEAVERFEEKDDSVIILRVVTRNEITKLAKN